MHPDSSAVRACEELRISTRSDPQTVQIWTPKWVTILMSNPHHGYGHNRDQVRQAKRSPRARRTIVATMLLEQES